MLSGKWKCGKEATEVKNFENKELDSLPVVSPHVNKEQEHFHTHLTKGLVRVNSALCRKCLEIHRWNLL